MSPRRSCTSSTARAVRASWGRPWTRPSSPRPFGSPDAVVAAPALVPSRGTLNGSALLVVDTSQSVGALRRAIRSGASGFYLWPAEREELAIAAARVGPTREESVGERAPVLAVYAPRGGSGGTFVATHLAAAFAKRQRRCVLVDLDVQFGDASAAIGVPADEAVRTIADLAPRGGAGSASRGGGPLASPQGLRCAAGSE